MTITDGSVNGEPIKLDAKPLDDSIRTLPEGWWTAIDLLDIILYTDDQMQVRGDSRQKPAMQKEESDPLWNNPDRPHVNGIRLAGGMVLDFTTASEDRVRNDLVEISKLRFLLDCSALQHVTDVKDDVPVVGIIHNLAEWRVVGEEISVVRNRTSTFADFRRTITPRRVQPQGGFGFRPPTQA